MMVYRLLYCILGPRLYAIYPASPSVGRASGRLYQPNAVETHTNRWLSAATYMSRACLAWYGIIIWAPFAYRNGYLTTTAGILWLTKAAIVTSATIFVLMCVRGLARYCNNDYVTFVDNIFCRSGTTARALAQYDFDLRYAPVDYVSGRKSASMSSSKILSFVLPNYGMLVGELKGSKGPKDFLANVATYLVSHTFGKHLLFPGTYNWIFHLMWTEFTKNRMKMVVDDGGERLKIRVAANGNDIDCVIIDRRGKRSGKQLDSGETSKGDYLVICCEGNAGFYEMGLPTIPHGAGYSILGWNYPGFVASTGLPYPQQIESSMEALMDYALNERGFPINRIIFYSWSIGGYVASWAAAHYPECAGVILDATFDDLYPLAADKMPQWFLGIVRRATQSYLALPIAQCLLEYPGPVRIIRRTKDEIICTDPADVSTNRGNHLLLRLLVHRYPKLFASTMTEGDGDGLKSLEAVSSWLSVKGAAKERYYHARVDDSLCSALICDHVVARGGAEGEPGGVSAGYPSQLGEGMSDKHRQQVALYVADKYMVDFSATHDKPLPEAMFVMPWSEGAHMGMQLMPITTDEEEGTGASSEESGEKHDDGISGEENDDKERE